ncbi:unnamed protein product [Brachionus calyciflorus]|uniref:Poly(A) RNA polymerase, mitochondrial-like n=1 Tax=Brachionus calyciflorus TaxID=104777 RepID=A0A813MKG9_9BILA|nr:unnamed protein product [Brachionus calyciflorus]
MNLAQKLPKLVNRIFPKENSHLNLMRYYYNKGLRTHNKSHNQQKTIQKFESDAIVKNFEDQITIRRRQAKNSILIKLENDSEVYGLLDDLDRIGTRISKIFVMGDHNMPNNRTALVEFESKECIDSILERYGTSFLNSQHLPSKTRLLLYKKFRQNTTTTTKQKFHRKYDIKFCLSNQSLDEKIKKMFDHFRLDESGSRIRYFIASVIEESFNGLFRNCLCLPFGSSANNFGHRTSDLDLQFCLEDTFFKPRLDEKHSLNLNGKMMFYSKTVKNTDERQNARLFLDLLNFIIGNVLPRFNVRQIVKNARVPILEFDFELPTGQRLNCDLSMSNLEVSYQMTKLFWTYTQLDNRVAQLIFFIKYWAKLADVTNRTSPSPRITNFQLTVLILNFLLRLENPLILPLENIVTNNGNLELKYIINNEMNISDLKNMLKVNNKSLLSDILMGFFNYYSNFDFLSNTISLTKNLNTKKNEFKHNPLVILNPFMPELNASKNVNRQMLKKFSNACNTSYELMQKSNNSLNLVEFFQTIKNESKNFDPINENNLADEMNK